MSKAQKQSAIAHRSPGDDALVVSCLVALCSFGIVLLSDFDKPMPAETMTTAPVDVTVLDDMPDSQPVAPAVPPASPVPATPAPTPSHSLISPAKTRPTLPSAPGFITLLGDTLNDSFFYRSEYSNPTGHYGGDWSRDNIGQTAEGADLDVRHQPSRSGPYTGGEMKTLKTYGYGRYEVVMRPAKGSGLVSSFFTYTGAYDVNPHDEIDIEFLGLDTSRIHFNYFRNGKTGESATFDLPFDAADADHLYAFEWAPEGITWYVDGQPYYKTVEGDAYLPTTPGSVIFNVWTGKPFMSAWHGKPTFESGASAHYSCVSFTPLGGESRACSDLFMPRPARTSRTLTAQLPQQATP